jgi:hypothetical protein
MRKTIEADEITPWEDWIIRTEKSHNVISNNYDKLCQLVVHQYKLHLRIRKIEDQDRLMYFCRWWFENKKMMRVYNSYATIGYLLGNRNHASIMHQVKHRQPSYSYKENVACIKDFLES